MAETLKIMPGCQNLRTARKAHLVGPGGYGFGLHRPSKDQHLGCRYGCQKSVMSSVSLDIVQCLVQEYDSRYTAFEKNSSATCWKRASCGKSGIGSPDLNASSRFWVNDWLQRNGLRLGNLLQGGRHVVGAQISLSKC